MSYAQAFCPAINFQNLPGTIDLTSDTSQKINFDVTRSVSGVDCRYKIGVDRGRSANYNRKLFFGNNTMDFTLATNQALSRIIQDVPDAANSNNYISGRFKKKDGNIQQQSIYTDLVVGQNKPAGNYEDLFNFKLYQRTDGNNYPLQNTRTVLFRYTILETISVSLVGTNAPFDKFDTSEDLNFGVLNSGAQKSFDIVIQSNSGYVLNVSSQNNGKIKHTGSASNSTIDYSFMANGSNVNLNGSANSPVVISTGNGQHSSDGFRIPIQIIMGNVESKLAGSYRDDLTVTVTTNL